MSGANFSDHEEWNHKALSNFEELYNSRGQPTELDEYFKSLEHQPSSTHKSGVGLVQGHELQLVDVSVPDKSVKFKVQPISPGTLV
ncbi:hypothetical protein OPQ81_002619 [Rhizoctonia solani]|nr:hypothetical protein OPQ81_002619 [Rhizoctonia solani]